MLFFIFVFLVTSLLSFLYYLFIFNFISCPSLLVQAVQAVHVVEEWVDHAHYKLKDEEVCYIVALKAQVVFEKKTKGFLLKLAEAERDRKSVEVALAGVEKQAEDQ